MPPAVPRAVPQAAPRAMPRAAPRVVMRATIWSTEVGGSVDFDEVMDVILSAWYKLRVVQPLPGSVADPETSVDLNDEGEPRKIWMGISI